VRLCVWDLPVAVGSFQFLCVRSGFVEGPAVHSLPAGFPHWSFFGEIELWSVYVPLSTSMLLTEKDSSVQPVFLRWCKILV